MYIGETVRDKGIDPHSLRVRIGIFGAEPWTEEMRREIEKALAIKAYDIYGLSEIAGPGVACECTEQNGMHVQEDFFYPEIIDPATGEQLPDGQEGELVFTCIGKEALPLIRYRTRDICSPHPREVRLRPHHRAHDQAPRAAPTTCSSSGASTCSPARSRACFWTWAWTPTTG